MKYEIVVNGITFKANTPEEAVKMAQLFAGTAPMTQTQTPVAGTGAAAPKTKAVKLYSTNVQDYEPKRGQDGQYVWASYKAQRSHYCYAVATAGNCNSNPYGSAWEAAGNKVDYDPNGAYYKAKAEYEATFKYVKKADR